MGNESIMYDMKMSCCEMIVVSSDQGKHTFKYNRQVTSAQRAAHACCLKRQAGRASQVEIIEA